jgi:hypothetical protein
MRCLLVGALHKNGNARLPVRDSRSKRRADRGSNPRGGHQIVPSESIYERQQTQQLPRCNKLSSLDQKNRRERL